MSHSWKYVTILGKYLLRLLNLQSKGTITNLEYQRWSSIFNPNSNNLWPEHWPHVIQSCNLDFSCRIESSVGSRDGNNCYGSLIFPTPTPLGLFSPYQVGIQSELPNNVCWISRRKCDFIYEYHVSTFKLIGYRMHVYRNYILIHDCKKVGTT